jgi:uncharacterized membrane protein HdeD (DUF308 family)
MNDVTDAARVGSRAGATWGIFVVILGMLAIGMPLLTGVAITMTLGVILLAAGVAQLVYAFKSKTFGEGAARFIFGGLAILAGLSLFAQPGAGLATITVFLAVWFVIDGIWSLVAAFKWRPFQGWGWMAFSGVVSIILGVMVYRQFPESAAWLVGLMVGIRLIFAGMTMIMMGSASEAVVDAVEKEGGL